MADPNVRVVAQIAPAVRVAVGDAFGLQKGRSVMGKIVNVLHRMGFDEVYDTTFSADLTIMEETAEFIDRVEKWRKASASDVLLSGMGKICRRSVPGLFRERIDLPIPTGYDVRSR